MADPKNTERGVAALREMFGPFSAFVFVASLVFGCGGHELSFPNREPGVRTPLSAACDPLDSTRCLLPWPSNVFTEIDPTSRTGLRLSLKSTSLPVLDIPDSLNRTDGFSVVTPLAVGFLKPIDHRLDDRKNATEVRLILAQPGHDDLGNFVPLRLAIVNDVVSSASLLLAYPMRTLEYDADYIAVVLDDVRAEDGTPFETPSLVKIALGLSAPASDEERALAAYHAPTRELLAQTGIDLGRVLRVWDFTTRSAIGVSAPLTTMRRAAIETVKADSVSVRIDSAAVFADGSAIDVRGHVLGLPNFVDSSGELSLGTDGLPQQVGVHAAPFRAVLPAGVGAYPLVVYGHGTGGTINEDAFDDEFVAAGAAKLSVEWIGWTASTSIGTLVRFEHPLSAAARSTAGLLQALSDAAALQAALSGKLGDRLASPTLLGTANPAAGRRPEVEKLVYAGGSLGGTMGFVHALVDPTIQFGILNVPGAAWTHFVPRSEMWITLNSLFSASTPSEIDRALGLAMTQSSWDPIDGAAWSALIARTDLMLLLQESIGDPVLPNIGTDFVAVASEAVQVGAVLEPILGVRSVNGNTHRSAVTQFRVPTTETSARAIHGFAARRSNAGVAAREQISAFLRSVWAGAPEIVVPPSCARRAGENCDFSRAE